MKSTFKVLIALLLIAVLALSAVACTAEENKKDDTTTTTTTKLTTPGNGDKKPDNKDENNKDDGNADDGDDEHVIEFVSSDEKGAQTTEMGNMVYWYDQNWDGVTSTVNVTEADLTDGVYTFAFTHTGANWHGAQLFYNPVDSENGDTYDVSFKVKSDVDTSITVCGTVYVLKADEEQTITYSVTLDMHPEDTNYQYGQSAFDVQFGVEEGNVDIVDGTYIFSELVLTKK